MYNINTIIHCRLCAVRKSYCYYCYYWIDLLQLILKVIYRCVWTQFLGLLTFLLICLLYYSWLQSFAICNFYICLRLVDLGSFLQLYFFVDQKVWSNWIMSIVHITNSKSSIWDKKKWVFSLFLWVIYLPSNDNGPYCSRSRTTPAFIRIVICIELELFIKLIFFVDRYFE